MKYEAAELSSPIVEGGRVTLVDEINVDAIIENYINVLSLDVKPYYKNCEKLQVYKCNATGYHFFYPFGICGDGVFYEKLEKFPWYYDSWKWEHENALKYFDRGSKVLEIGAAQGSFLAVLREKQILGVGLELNQNAILEAEKKGLTMFNESMSVHANKYKEEYDAICSFQVMEHISDIQSFVNDQLKGLKKGGYLIVSVPNNASFLGKDNNILNLPPHHMGLWDEKSLCKLTEFFPLKVVDVGYEPLKRHRAYFNNVVVNYLKAEFGLSKKITSKLSRLFTLFSSRKFQAFTVQVVYRKV